MHAVVSSGEKKFKSGAVNLSRKSSIVSETILEDEANEQASISKKDQPLITAKSAPVSPSSQLQQAQEKKAEEPAPTESTTTSAPNMLIGKKALFGMSSGTPDKEDKTKFSFHDLMTAGGVPTSTRFVGRMQKALKPKNGESPSFGGRG